MRAPSGELPPLVLVVSDLHLAGGRDATGRTDLHENFFADDAFGRFLDHHLPRPSTPPGPLLVLNGDTFDFLRIVTIPDGPADFARWQAALDELGYRPRAALADTLVRKERRYGLRTEDYKTIWKFREIADGHPAFFAGLGRWVAGGGRIVFVKGNHDLELHWPLLAAAIRAEIGRQGGVAVGDDAVEIRQESFRLHNMYGEHGHRFEAMTRVSGPPTIYRGEEIRYPFASFLHKYVLNQLEGLDPFLDNVKPASRVLPVAIREHPLSAIGILFHGLRALKPVLIRDSFTHVVALLLVLATLGVPVVVVTLAVLSFVFEPVHDWLASVIASEALRRGLAVGGALLPWIVSAIRELAARRRRYGPAEDPYGAGMHEVAASLAPPFRRFYGVTGHTHRMDVQDLGRSGACRIVYVNSGAWTPRWDDRRPDLIGRIEYSFIRFRFRDGEYEAEPLEWCDERGAAAPALIFRPRPS